MIDGILRDIAAWQVLIVQFNELVARQLRVTPSQLQCLYVLSHLGPSSPGALARHIGINTGTASRMVDRLLAVGLVTRSSHDGDRRRVVVAATPDALAQVARHYDPLNTRLRRLLDDMPSDALAQMHDFVIGAEKAVANLLQSLSDTREIAVPDRR